MENKSREVTVCADLGELSGRAATHFVDRAIECTRERGRFTVCLSGGSTPRQTYALLADERLRDGAPWHSIHIFWGDERVIPLERPDNHFRMASDLFLDKVPIPPSNIHRARVEMACAEAAADDYETELRSFFKVTANELPRFDMIILGMGADGHTASLFPGTAALTAGHRLVAAHFVPKLNAERLTLTLPVLNNAREIMFLVSGSNKADALRAVLQVDSNPLDLPARSVKPNGGQVFWLVDKDAASQLQSSLITEAVAQ